MGGLAEQAFGRVLRRLRAERHLSQERLAELAGGTRGYVSLLERGVNSPTLSKLVELAAAFGLRPSEVLALAEAEMDGLPLPGGHPPAPPPTTA